MFCPKCSAAVADNSRVCSQCGQTICAQPEAASARFQGTQVGRSVPRSASTAPDALTSGKALASMICGVLGLFLLLPAIAAIVLGHMSRSEIRGSNGELKGLGMSTAGLVMGYGSVLMVPLLLIIWAISIPNLVRSRNAANEAAAVGSVRMINSAEISYLQLYPEIGFTCTLDNLGGTAESASSSEHAKLIDNILASSRKDGYRFSLENCVNTDTEHKYQVVAYPQSRHNTGDRTFCSSESEVIKAGEGESAEACLANGTPLQ